MALFTGSEGKDKLLRSQDRKACNIYFCRSSFGYKAKSFIQLHNNYYFLRRLSTELEQKLAHAELTTCFSQNKDELILGFILAQEKQKGKDFYIKAHLHSNFCCLQFPDDYNRSNKNSVDIFPEITGSIVSGLRQFQNERSFAIQLKNDSMQEELSLLFKMHGNRSNIILCKNKSATKLFKNNLAKDLNLHLDHLDKKIDQSRQAFLTNNGDHKLLFPTFGKIPEKYLENQGFYLADSLEEKWEILQSLLKMLENPEAFYIIRLDQKPALSLLRIGEEINTHKDPMEALNDFFLTYIREESLKNEKNEVLKGLKKQQKHSENYIQKTRNKLEEITNKTGNEEKANIIMANLHNIPDYAEQVTLPNFYDNNNPITIKIKPHLSPQKNAENYYNKAKHQKIEIEQLQNNLEAKQKHFESITSKIEAINSFDNIKALRKYLKEQGLEKSQTSQQKPVPFKQFNVEGYDVLVGKNAAANDDLLRDYTWKDDLWLHARDVPGSHVVIKQQAGKNIPDTVIEQAAKLAAQYSKRKNDTLCPVIYTPRKYVRKTKDLGPGQVIVDKEEVIMVEP